MKTLADPRALARAPWPARARLLALRRRQVVEACLAHMTTYGPDPDALGAQGWHQPMTVVEQTRAAMARKIGAVE